MFNMEGRRRSGFFLLRREATRPPPVVRSSREISISGLIGHLHCATRPRKGLPGAVALGQAVNRLCRRSLLRDRNVPAIELGYEPGLSYEKGGDGRRRNFFGGVTRLRDGLGPFERKLD